MPVHSLPCTVLAPEDEGDPERAWSCFPGARCRNLLPAHDIAQIRADAGSQDVELVGLAIREVWHQPVEKPLDFGPGARTRHRAKYGDRVSMGPEGLSRSGVAVEECGVRMVL